MTLDEQVTQLRQFQLDLCEIIRPYLKQGHSYGELAKCLLNIAALMVIDSGMPSDEGINIFKSLIDIGREDLVNDPLNN